MNLSDLIQFNDPQYYSGGAEGGTDVLRPQTVKTIAGIPISQFLGRQGPAAASPTSGEVGPTSEVYNPQTGQWERGYVVPGLDPTQALVPESIAKNIPGSAPYLQITPHPVDWEQGLEALGVGVGGPLFGGAITSALGGAGAAGGIAGLGPMGVDSAGIFGGSGAALGGAGAGVGSLADLGPMGLDSYAATGGVGAGTSWTAGGAAAGAGGAALTDSGTGTFGSPGADATAAQATSGGTIGSGAYDAGTAAAAGAGAAGAAGTGASAASALSKVLNGTATADDYAKLLGQVAPGLLGAYGASQQSSALSGLADKYFNVGAPSRARYEASMTPGFDPLSIPGYKGALDTANESAMHALSTQGNPFGNPSGLIDAQQRVVNGTALPAIQNYQALNANAGGISSMNAAAPGTAAQAIGSSGGVLSALGSAAGNVLNPPQTADQSLAALLKLYGSGSGNIFQTA